MYHNLYNTTNYNYDKFFQNECIELLESCGLPKNLEHEIPDEVIDLVMQDMDTEWLDRMIHDYN